MYGRGRCPLREWLDGFCMAWGMGLAIPCPFRRWNEAARRKMVACLPLVGIVVGAVWALCAWLAGSLPHPLGAALCAAAPWLVTGFLHLDGFMDVCDGILSRRDLETRRRILKDSHCGAFAVICMVLLAMGQWSAFLSMDSIPLLPLALVPVSSRAAAAVAVLTLRPMTTSQYSTMERGGTPVYVSAAVLTAACIAPAVLWGSFAPLAAAAGYGLAVHHGYRQFDGMSGDISGFGLVLGELCGAVVLALGR